MPDPTDPRDAALSNIQDTSRAYGRGRRRGSTANVDPAFTAALEITDPEQRRAALAQYARQRAQGVTGSPAPISGNALPSQASVMSQVMPPDRAQMAEDKMRQESAMMADRLGRSGGLSQWQNQPFPGPEDSPETHQFLMQSGNEIAGASEDQRMYDDLLKYGTPDDVQRYQNIPMVGTEDSPEQHNARIVAGKQILASRAQPIAQPEPDADDGISRMGNAAEALEQQIMARRRRR